MALKTHAGDLDLFDRFQTRRRLQVQARTSNQLPAHPAGNSQSTNTEKESEAGHLRIPTRSGMRALQPDARAPIPQKENQCQES